MFSCPLKLTEMQTIDIYQIDAFATHPFTGNPAAVCVLPGWIEEDLMQKIALENNLAETAFIVSDGDDYQIRWFTPVTEVDLCGHATLASSYVVLHVLHLEKKEVVFHTRKMGDLVVRKRGEMLELDFPADTVKSCILPDILKESLGREPLECFMGRSDFLLLYSNEKDITDLKPDFRMMAAAGARGVIVTAPGSDVDFVSRFFAPQVGVDEDPVTGSAHTTLTPFWSARLEKQSLRAKQLSARGGYLECSVNGDRTLISGRAILYLKGEIYI
jgi:PhzF family phenazine biosynthesis protein